MLALSVAERCNGEIVNADAFQLYRGLEILSAQPDASSRRRVPHHLLGVTNAADPMSAAMFREIASDVIADVVARGRTALVVGGSGLYIKALTHGFDHAAPPDPVLRQELSALATPQLAQRLQTLDRARAARTDLKNRRRIIRAIEIAEAQHVIPSEGEGSRGESLTLLPRDHSSPIRSARDEGVGDSRGVVLVRDRDDLYARVNQRVNEMFEAGVEEEVARLTNIGVTAAQALGLREIQQLLAHEISRQHCIARIQQKTRRYARRQLTWFRHQTSFPQLNLTPLSQEEALSAIVQEIAPE